MKHLRGENYKANNCFHHLSLAHASVNNTPSSTMDQQCYKATGKSMLPTIWHGDHVQLEYTKHFVLGETLVYLEQDRLVAHRVVEMNDTTVWTRGDNQSGPPQAVPRSAILGRVVSIQRPKSPWVALKRGLWLRHPSAMGLACRIKQQVLTLRPLTRKKRLDTWP